MYVSEGIFMSAFARQWDFYYKHKLLNITDEVLIKANIGSCIFLLLKVTPLDRGMGRKADGTPLKRNVTN